ncbi:MAG TPA: serine/threonine-protein kinase [Gemmatales bacterium]|nr:serine/threonine-protein kinase [Gemmatales bacterium]
MTSNGSENKSSANPQALLKPTSEATTSSTFQTSTPSTVQYQSSENPYVQNDRLEEEETKLLAAFAGHPRYRLIKRIGSGGMGVIYLAEHVVMNRQVVVKFIHPRLLKDEEHRDRFIREVRASAQLAHSHIVVSYDAEVYGDYLFLVMEYIIGESLASILQAKHCLPFHQACLLMRQAADALQFAWSKGFVHRDIKPHNLIVSQSNELKILDFGLTRLVNEDKNNSNGLTLPGAFMGTPDYMAPEQSRDATNVDIRADIYSLGCTFYQTITGHVPFEGGSIADKIVRHATEKPRNVSAHPGDFPPELNRIIYKMLAKSPEERYQTPHDFLKDLDRVSDAKYTHAAPGVLKSVSKLSRPIVLLSVCLLTLILMVLAGIIIHITTDQGVLIVESSDPDVQLAVEQNGKIVKIIDAKSQQKFILDSGDYTLRIADKPDSFRIELPVGTFKLRRGDKQSIIIQRIDMANVSDDRKVLDYRELHAASLESAKEWFRSLENTDFYPIYLNVTTHQTPQVTALAIRDGSRVKYRYFLDIEHGGREWVSYWKDNVDSGFRNTSCCWYMVNNKYLAAGLWYADGRRWFGYGGLLPSMLLQIEEARKNKMRPVAINPHVFQENGFDLICATNDVTDWQTQFEVPKWELSKAIDQKKKMGLRPAWISCYRLKSNDYFCISFIRDTAANDWNYHVDLSKAEYDKLLSTNKKISMRPAVLCQYPTNDQMKYAVVWQKYSPAK